jgi:hypothetical protein
MLDGDSKSDSEEGAPTSFLQIAAKRADKGCWVRAAAMRAAKYPGASGKLADWVTDTLNEAAKQIGARETD